MEGVSYKLPWLIGDMSQLILMDTPASEFGVGAIRTARDWAGTLFPWRVHCSPLLRNENCLVHLVHGSKLWWLKTPEIQRNLKGEMLGLKWSEASPLNCQLTPVPEANNTMASWAAVWGAPVSSSGAHLMCAKVKRVDGPSCPKEFRSGSIGSEFCETYHASLVSD